MTKYVYFILILYLKPAFANIACAIDCASTIPCGIEQLICCAAYDANESAGKTLFDSPEAYYNSMLFKRETQDGFCQNPQHALNSDLQKYYYSHYCQSAGDYYTYTNLITAASVPAFSAFGCIGTRTLRYKELANFFATIAQETTAANGSPPYTNDGLYFRYENGALLTCSSTAGGLPSSLCTAPNSHPDTDPYTIYYPLSNLIVIQQDTSRNTYTPKLYLFPNSPATVYDIASSPEKISFSHVTLPKGSHWLQLNDDTLLIPQLWIGVGPMQLTGQSVFEFFGWYENNIEHPARIYSDFSGFEIALLNNGVIGFQSALWYWMFRVNGFQYQTIHQMVTDRNRPVCQDIAAVTLRVNGGCNNYTPPAGGRLPYAQYFSKLFKIRMIPVQCTTSTDAIPENTNLNSLSCNMALQEYCQPINNGTCLATETAPRPKTTPQLSPQSRTVSLAPDRDHIH